MQEDILTELYVALDKTDAPPILQAIVGSWLMGLDDEEVLDLLQDFNKMDDIEFLMTHTN